MYHVTVLCPYTLCMWIMKATYVCVQKEPLTIALYAGNDEKMEQ